MIDFDKKAKKEFAKLDKKIQKKIDKFILKLTKASHPRRFGKPLDGNMNHLWCYRVGDYRIICSLEDDIVTVIILKVAHRKKVYLKQGSL